VGAGTGKKTKGAAATKRLRKKYLFRLGVKFIENEPKKVPPSRAGKKSADQEKEKRETEDCFGVLSPSPGDGEETCGRRALWWFHE